MEGTWAVCDDADRSADHFHGTYATYSHLSCKFLGGSRGILRAFLGSL